MDVLGLESFLAIVRTGSVQKAAQELGVSRSALRRRLSKLEESFGQGLLVRSPRGVSPTSAGRRVLAEAPELVRRARALQAAVERPFAVDARPLVMLAPDGLPPRWSARLGVLIAKALPELRLVVHFVPDPVAALTPDVDLALQFGDAIPEGPFRTRVVLRMPERLVATPRYLEKHGTPQTIDDLQDHRLLSWIPPGESGAAWPLPDGGRVAVNPVFLSPDIHLIRLLAVEHQGIARVPDPPRFADELGGDLQTVLPGVVGGERNLRIVFPDGHGDSPRVRAGLALLDTFLTG